MAIEKKKKKMNKSADVNLKTRECDFCDNVFLLQRTFK